MSKKKVKACVKIQIGAGSATPGPPIGPALGQQGVNLMEFCKAFNAKTSNLEKGLTTPVLVTVYTDRTFSFVIKTPPASVLIKKTLGLKAGSGNPKTTIVGTLTYEQLQEIARMKAPDMIGVEEEARMACIAGTARSMGVTVLSKGETHA